MTERKKPRTDEQIIAEAKAFMAANPNCSRTDVVRAIASHKRLLELHKSGAIKLPTPTSFAAAGKMGKAKAKSERKGWYAW